jgi:hypothetical protein
MSPTSTQAQPYFLFFFFNYERIRARISLNPVGKKPVEFPRQLFLRIRLAKPCNVKLHAGRQFCITGGD